MTESGLVRVGLAGARGYGAVHRDHLAELADRCRLVGVADTAGRPDDLDPGVPLYPSLGELLAAQECDVINIATPISTHVPLALEAMRAGKHVYLEKPPTPDLAGLAQLVETSRATGRACQIGFQAIGSLALPAMREVIASGDLGAIRVVAATGTWLRTRRYFERSAWAGRRRLGDVPVADGVATNALSHSIAEALRLVDVVGAADVASVSTECYRAWPDNESDDTTFVRVDSASGPPVTAALTLCHSEQPPPRVDVIGERGRLSLSYTDDVLTLELPSGRQEVAYGRTDLMANLLDHIADPAVPLLVPVAETGAFTAVLAALQRTPVTLLADGVTWEGDGDGAHPVVADVDRWVREAAESGRGFAASGAPWASGELTLWQPAE